MESPITENPPLALHPTHPAPGRDLLAVLWLVVAAFAVYGPSLGNGFLWDDTALVLRDPLIRSWRLIPEGFRHFLFTDATASDFYRPLQRLTYTIDYALGGFTPSYYHFTNILLHALAAVAFFAFLRELTKERIVPAIAATLWVIHPMNSSAVMYVAGRADLLAAFFGFGALWLGLRKQDGLAFGGFLLALLSKEMGVVFLLVWALIALWQRRSRQFWIQWGTLVVVLFGIYFALRLGAEHLAPPVDETSRSLGDRILLGLRALAQYVGLYLFPANLRMERTVAAWDCGVANTQLGALAFAGAALWIGLVGWAVRTKQPLERLLLGCGLLAYLPTSNLFSLNATFAEHWFYTPGAFLLGAAALALQPKAMPLQPKAVSLQPENEFPARAASRLLPALLLCWAIGLGVRTWVRNAEWKDPRTLFTRTIENGGDSSRIWTNLGALEQKEGHLQEAMRCYQKAMESPQPFAQMGIAGIEMELGNYSAARSQVEPLLKRPFFRPQALMLVAALDRLEKGLEPTDLIAQAAQLAPENWAIQKKYLLHLAGRGQLKKAIEELTTLLEKQWWRAESWKLLGDLLARRGFPSQEAYRRAAELDVHLQLGVR